MEGMGHGFTWIAARTGQQEMKSFIQEHCEYPKRFRILCGLGLGIYGPMRALVDPVGTTPRYNSQIMRIKLRFSLNIIKSC